jgi:hypothetical protein
MKIDLNRYSHFRENRSFILWGSYERPYFWKYNVHIRRAPSHYEYTHK